MLNVPKHRSRRRVDHSTTPRGYVTPADWTWQHVGYCLIRAFRVLRLMPGAIGPRSVGSSWPHDLHDLRDLIEAVAASKRSDTKAKRPRPSSEAIRQMDAAIQWPAEYLKADADRSALVQAVAKGLAHGIDFDDVAERMQLTTDLLLRRYRLGLNAIALRLQKAGEPVWELE